MANYTPAQLANFATRALLYEVSVNPKPGLVDPVSSGPHPDMTVFTFINSSLSMQPYLEFCAEAGANYQGELPGLFQKLRPAGVKAEAAMNQATSGVNTHKGAIFSLGILLAATAYQQTVAAEDTSVQSVIKQMLEGLTDQDFANVAQKPEAMLTSGEKLYLEYGLTGVRGEAEAGYPSVFAHGLPTLEQAQGSLNDRLLDSLLAIVAHFTDTNLIHRAGSMAVVAEAQAQAQEILDAGGAQTASGKKLILQMNADFLTRNLSLGGSADMLILTIFLALVQNEI